MPVVLAATFGFRRPDMLVIGFQEIVPLTAQQIIQTDPEKRYVRSAFGTVYLKVCHRRIWENKIIETLDRRPNKTCNYVLLRSEQVIFLNISPTRSFRIHANSKPLAGGNGSDGAHKRTLNCRHSERGGHDTESTLTYVHYYDSADAGQTGLRGMSGNKGAVGIRLEYHDTSFCFLTAHLAAGQLNIEERNADYRTIASGLHFQKGKTISGHE